ncbi:hypothetical protein, partial [Yersinia ruckeri]|uniref:hypothetical protein n=1 Tax=Yersinia ruckeri TaxID=29486 RepID=UPI001E565938
TLPGIKSSRNPMPKAWGFCYVRKARCGEGVKYTGRTDIPDRDEEAPCLRRGLLAFSGAVEDSVRFWSV